MKIFADHKKQEVINLFRKGYTHHKIAHYMMMPLCRVKKITSQYLCFKREENSRTREIVNVYTSKKEPYYANEMEYGFKCVIPLSRNEMSINPDPKYLDLPYHKNATL